MTIRLARATTTVALTFLATALLAGPAHAGKIRSSVDAVGNAAINCANSGLCSKAGPTGKAFSAAVKSMDVLGCEIGRTMVINQHGKAADPGNCFKRKR